MVNESVGRNVALNVGNAKLLEVKKNAVDENNYRFCVLENGLEALLVNVHSADGSELKSGAGLAVQVGSFFDPENVQGCAHFLEHMLFMGSKKYPSENAYDQYISGHGGSCNAFTEGDHTVYQFDVSTNYLAKALDIFAQCISAPLLRKEAMSREVKAIESEYNLAQLDDSCRRQQLQSAYMCDGHPLKIFGWGNRMSLEEDTAATKTVVHDELVKFYREFYKPEHMKLVVVSPLSLDDLEVMVNKSFASWMKTRGHVEPAPLLWLPGAVAEAAKLDPVKGLPFESDAFGVLTQMIPLRREDSLQLVWQFPSMMSQYHTKSGDYVAHLIAHEGRGSLLSVLKEEGLALQLVGGAGEGSAENNVLTTLMTISVKLTSKGVANWPRVVRLTLEYIRRLEEQGPQEWIFNELRVAEETKFKFLDSDDVWDTCEELVLSMLPSMGVLREDILRWRYMRQQFVPEQVSAIVSHMSNAANVKITLSAAAYRALDVETEEAEEENDPNVDDEWVTDESDAEDVMDEEEDDFDDEDSDDSNDSDDSDNYSQPEDDGECITVDELVTLASTSSWERYISPPAVSPLKEKYFGVKHWNVPIEDDLYSYWSPSDISPAIQLPVPNEFLPESTDMVAEHVPSTEPWYNPLWTDGECTAKTGAHRLWHVQDVSYNRPKATAHFIFNSQKLSSPRLRVALDLLVLLVKDSLTETLYMAELADLNFSLTSTSTSMTLVVAGLSDKIPKLVETIIATIYDEKIVQDMFMLERAIQTMRNKVENRLLKSERVSNLARVAILIPNDVTVLEIRHEIINNEPTVESMLSAYREIIPLFQINAMVYGNITESLAMDVFNGVINTHTKYIVPENVTSPSVAHNSAINIPDNTLFFCHTNPLLATEPNVGVQFYLQLGKYTPELEVFNKVVGNLLYEPFFDDLRTKQQLGYTVDVSARISADVLGLTYFVVSSAFSAEHVTAQIMKFALSIEQLISKMEDSFVDETVSSYLNELECRPTSMYEIVDAISMPINTESYEFSRRQKEIAILRSGIVTKERILQFVRDHFSSLNNCRAILSIASVRDAPIDLTPLQKIFSKAKIHTLANPRDVLSHVSFY